MNSIPILCWLMLFAAPLLASVGGDRETSFESAPPGAFEQLETELGVWTVAVGEAAIDSAHARRGAQCLHLKGGEESAVELRFAAGTLALHELTFWAERWTRAEPFGLRIEVRRNGKWVERRDASEEVAVGGFETRLRIGVDARVDGLRLSCTSPPGKGVLIDDLELHLRGPMKIASCTIERPTLPVLLGERLNPVARLEIVTTGNEGPLIVESVELGPKGALRPEVVEVYWAGERRELDRWPPDVALSRKERFGKARTGDEDRLVFRGRRELESGTNVFWISAEAGAQADLDGLLRIDCTRVSLRGGRELIPDDGGGAEFQRMGVALRDAGDDDCAVYRIPGLATTNAGTLIAVYDARWWGWGDLPAHIDVGMSRSTDGGRNWEPMTVILDMGDDARWQGDGVGDPSILVDRETGAIFVAAVWSHGERGWNGSGPGLEPEETGQLVMVRSDDDGRSWSKPVLLTRMLKDPSWSFLLPGPGRGITMEDGTLVFPAQFQLSPDQGREPRSTVIWSRDHGESWEIGSGARGNTTESAVVELAAGTLMLNMRDNRGGSRAVHVSDDLGASWREHPTSRSALEEPVCMASLIHVGRELHGEADGLLLFSNPNVDRAPRRRMTIRMSRDSGASWRVEDRLLLDEGRSAGYSCLTMVDERTVGILYEGSRAQLVFQRIPLADCLGSLR